MFLDSSETIRFRVLSEQFTEIAPIQKEALMAARSATLAGATPSDTQAAMATPVGSSASTVAPYRIVASIAEDGLGLSRWWLSAAQDD